MINLSVTVLCVCVCFEHVLCNDDDVDTTDNLENSDYITDFPELPVCGISKNGFYTKVVGGVDANLGEFPWMALLGYNDSAGNDTFWSCGGSLISQRHVLTAAHCIHNHDELYVVRLGELDVLRNDDGATPLDIHIKRKIEHEAYSANSFQHDIGLLILDTDVVFSDLIRPICIPLLPELRNNLFEDYNPFIAGWGYNAFPGHANVQFRFGDLRKSHLQKVSVPVTRLSQCQEVYKSYGKSLKIDEQVICGGYEGGKNSCKGDSGGPLMLPNTDSEQQVYFYQIGIVSLAPLCALKNYPTVFTRVTHYIPWLQTQVLGRADF
ncbi:venom protease-like isoform X2 [Danaus plexippus]|uniref:venom protease-like isoform X2 n=1 Tax=Danaus plexippus TaxID=13037 RepID=UPI002AB24838|nr:venom protease-like isoform X2 [Danaus plexippus]